MRSRSVAGDVLLALLAASTAIPLWLVRYLPIQDLPQHLAAIRVLHSFAVPAFHFREHFELALGSTQYLAFYVLGHLLAYPLGVETGHRVLLTAVVVSTPLAVRALLRSLGLDRRLALFAVGLAFNVHLLLGFEPFLASIPLMLLALAWSVDLAAAPGWRRSMALAALLVLSFLTHVVPFAFAWLGAALMIWPCRGAGAGTSRPRDTLVRALPLVPSAALAVGWAAGSEAGRTTLAALEAGTPPSRGAGDALAAMASSVTDVFATPIDETLLAVLLALGGAALALAVSQGREPAPSSARDAARSRIGLLAPLALLLYFVAPGSFAWIWPINARFALLALLLGIPLLPAPRGWRGRALFGAVALVGALHVGVAARAFVAFDREEVGRLDDAIGAIPAGERVVGLMYRPRSRIVRFAPFLHAVAYYQTRKGGAVMFTFADFPQSPFRFRRDHRPPRVPPRWEWRPEAVNVHADLGWYRWVLVRGGPGPISHMPEDFALVYRDAMWSVWRHLR